MVIHGFCVDHRLLLGLDPVLAARGGWRRIYLDLPGMGRSVAGPQLRSSDAVADAVASFIRDTVGSAPFALLGNSYGGMLARHLAAEFAGQVLGLALLCPVAVAVAENSRRVLPPRSILRQDPALLASLAPEDAEAYAEMAVIQSAENWELFRDSVLPGLRSFDRSAIGRIAGRYALSVEPEDRAEVLAGPTLIIAGRQDHVVGFANQAALAERYPDSELVILDNAGHNAHLDRPGAVAELLDAWLRRMDNPQDS